MKRRLITAAVAALLVVGVLAIGQPSEARFGTSCPWAIQQYSQAQAAYGACAAIHGPTPPNDSSHPCWSQFGTMHHFARLVEASCEIHQQP